MRTAGSSASASLSLAGEVTVDLDVASVTIPFGAAGAEPTYLDWDAFADKYLFAGDAAREGVRALLATGAERAADPTAPAPTGTAASPWLVGAEASFSVETRLPASSVRLQDQPSTPGAGVDTLDIAPMKELSIASELSVRLERQEGAGWTAVVFDPARLALAPVTGPVPEATWRFRPPKEIAAAANNLTAVVGVRLDARASGRDSSAVVSVGTLATDDPAFARPLPFARVHAADLASWHADGLAAETLAAVGSGSDGSRADAVAEAILTADGRFAERRAASGLRAAGLPAVAARTLSRARSAPPFVAPLSQGMTMRPPALPTAPPPRRSFFAQPVTLDGPRLRAVLRPPSATVASVLTAPATTVRSRAIPRTLPPAADPSLRRAPTMSLPPATRAASVGLAIAGPETGMGAGRAHARAIAAAEAAIRKDGVAIAGGTTQVWDVPRGAWRLRLAGTSALRVTSLARGGGVLSDVELVPAEPPTRFRLPAEAARVALTAMGQPVAGAQALRGLSGWTATQAAVRVGGGVALVAGGHLVLPREPGEADESVVPITRLLAGSRGVETALPVATRVVAVLLDEADCSAADAGDLAVSVRGAEAAAPVRLAVDGRRAILYEVKPARGAASIAVALASARGFRVAAVLGLAGGAAEVAAWLRARRLQISLPDAFASAATVVTVVLEGRS